MHRVVSEEEEAQREASRLGPGRGSCGEGATVSGSEETEETTS